MAKQFTRDDAAAIVASRMGIAPAAAAAIVNGMSDNLWKEIESLNLGPRPDVTIRALVDGWADAQQPPKETEVRHVLRQDGTWGDEILSGPEVQGETL